MAEARSASELMSARIAKIGGWRAATLDTMRTLIKEADPGVVEELKWMGTPVGLDFLVTHQEIKPGVD